MVQNFSKRIKKITKYTKKLAFTITELIISIFIASLLVGYAWKIYFESRETTRHTVTQSQLQAQMRIFLDKFARDIACTYRFYNVDYETKTLGLYSFQITRTPLDEIFYDTLRGTAKKYDDYAINVLKIEYKWNNDGTIIRTQTPGYLYFLRKPMVFQEGPASQYQGTENAPYSKVILTNVTEFSFKPYQQVYRRTTSNPQEPPKVEIIPITQSLSDPTKAARTSFVTVKIKASIDEVGSRRDEIIEIVGKFYSRVRLYEAAYLGYFCTTDEFKNF